MPQNWKTYKLGEVAKIKYGKDHKKLGAGSIPCIGTGGVMRYVDTHLSKEESVLIPRKGSLNNIYYVNKPFWTVDTLFWTQVNWQMVSAKYLYYSLKTIDFASKDVGSAVPSLTTELLNNLEFLFPPLPEQRAIASILSSLDDKIELNLQMNKTLEEMAMTLYKHWFVDFGPFKDGKFIDSELGLIPEGWEVMEIGQITTELRRGISPSYTEEEGVKVINQRCIRNHIIDFSLARKNDVNKKKVDGRLIQLGDILVNSTGVGTLGRLAPVLDLTEDFVVDSHVTVIRVDPKVFQLNVFARSMLSIESIIEGMGEGSTGQTELSRVQLSEMRILVPPFDLQTELESELNDFSQKVVCNLSENQTLTTLRDTLLPKLISGEVRVKDAEQTLAQVL